MGDTSTIRGVSAHRHAPLGFAAGDTNLYRMEGNDPVNLTDPTGLKPRAKVVKTFWHDTNLVNPKEIKPADLKTYIGKDAGFEAHVQLSTDKNDLCDYRFYVVIDFHFKTPKPTYTTGVYVLGPDSRLLTKQNTLFSPLKEGKYEIEIKVIAEDARLPVKPKPGGDLSLPAFLRLFNRSAIILSEKIGTYEVKK